MELRFWGVRGSIPAPGPDTVIFGGNTACIEVRPSGGEVIVIDGGTGIRNLGAALAKEFPGPVSPHVLLTHFHWDHIQGIPFFAPLLSPSNEVTFYSGFPAARTREVLEAQMRGPYFPVPFSRLAARRHVAEVGATPLRIGSATVRAFAMHHPQGAWGYRIEADGAVLVHACDAEHGDPDLDGVLRQAAEGADVLIYDSQYTPEEYEARRGWGHSTWLHATRLAREAGVGRLLLFHHDPDRDDAGVARIEVAARGEFARTDAAREGMIVTTSQ